MGKLALIGGNESLFVEGTTVDMGIEIAIRAFGGAERPMYIDAEKAVGAGTMR